MNILKQIIVLLTTSFLLCVSCSEKANNDENIVARFGEKYLYKEQILPLIPVNATVTDSADFIKTYIQSWGMKNALFEKAEHNISYKNDEIEEQVQRFRAELYINKYEELFAQQKLDTIITITQLDAYYATHKTAEFILEYDVVKVLFVQLPKQYVTPKLRQTFATNSVDDLDHLKDLCGQYSTKFYLDDKWVNLELLKQEIPKSLSTQELLNPRGVIIDFEDNVYFIKITNHISAGKPAPREMMYERIAANLLYKRRIELLNTMRTKVYQDALRKNEFEIFYK
ncbi:MAG: hypothetical protein FWC39_12115 [Bacteroidetes bacterium]|nr:hypothetical protein [Bacteroidota bacterium]MCL2329240.1 hypothetical protein [Bacteroidota bacterium]